MSEHPISKIESFEDVDENSVRVTVIMDKKQMAKEYSPYYDIQGQLRDKLIPLLVADILKNKDEIIAQVIKDVNWPEIVRSEVAQKVIQEIATKRNY